MIQVMLLTSSKESHREKNMVRRKQFKIRMQLHYKENQKLQERQAQEVNLQVLANRELEEQLMSNIMMICHLQNGDLYTLNWKVLVSQKI